MTIIPTRSSDADVCVSETLWRSTMAPEGILERWNCADGASVAVGDSLALVRVEDSLHELAAPLSGRLRQFLATNAVIEPGTVIGRISA